MPALTLQPDETTGVDTYLDQPSSTCNFGITNVLRVRASATVQRRSMVQFTELSTIPSSASVVSASLLVYCLVHSPGDTVHAHRALTAWYEGDANGASLSASTHGSTWALRDAYDSGSAAWGAAGGLAGTDYATVSTACVAITGSGTSFSWDVTTDVADFVAGTASNLGWWLIGTVAIAVANQFVSATGTTASQRPKLVTTYNVPPTPFSPGWVYRSNVMLGV